MKDWKKRLGSYDSWAMNESLFITIDGETIYDIDELKDFIQQEIEKAREEGFDDGVKRTVDVVQKGLDELLLERGEDKYWVGDILRDCNSSVEKLLPKEMKHYLSKLTTK